MIFPEIFKGGTGGGIFYEILLPPVLILLRIFRTIFFNEGKGALQHASRNSVSPHSGFSGFLQRQVSCHEVVVAR